MNAGWRPGTAAEIRRFPQWLPGFADIGGR
jgi:hypothetical protein